MTADVTVTKLHEFLAAVDDIEQDGIILFRGQRNSTWNLEPSLNRLVPDVGETKRDAERNMVVDFARLHTPYAKERPPNDWELVAAAQHHGMMTRLLDWTENPLAALWFAVRVPADGAVLGLVTSFAPESGDLSNPATDNLFLIKKTKFFQPQLLDSRIIAQKGWFSAHAWNAKSERYSRLDHLSGYKPRLTRIQVPASAFAEIRRALGRFGIDDSTMFPDLDGVARHINWMRGKLSDEVEGAR